LRILGGVVAAVAAGWFGYVFLGSNKHTVLPGKVYRSAQLSGPALEKTIRSHGIRTVLNLRGPCPDFDWYVAEATACAATDADLEDVTLSAKCLPSPGEVRRIVDIFDRAAYPIIVHCKEGKDRTGLVAAMVLLLHTDATLARARQELWPIWGHFRVARTVAMDEFFDQYERWLDGRPHAPSLFRDWCLTHYLPSVGKSEIVWQTKPPPSVPRGSAPSWNVRVFNRSFEAWHLQPGSTAAVHLRYAIYPAGSSQGVFEDQAGLMRKVVKPGLWFDATIALPPLRTPGRYLLKLEMFDFRGAGIGERSVPFSKYGDDPVLVEFDVN
jgi:protein tyrosine phosphatase (PTP) superfamily phosphohydrolase (DUF442 family)